MEKVSIDEIEPTPIADESERCGLTAPLGMTDLAINRYRLAPGEGFPGGLHAHMDQEEVFVVLDGAAAFETMDGTVTVESGEAIRFAPGEFQSGRTVGDDPLHALALGAPRDTEDTRLPAECPACGHETLRLETDGQITFECPGCGAGHRPAECPACGHHDLQFTIGPTEEPVVACQGCDATFEQPPLRE